MTNTTRRTKLARMTLLAMLVAVLIVLAYVNIPMPMGLSITFNMIPVAIAAMAMGLPDRRRGLRPDQLPAVLRHLRFQRAGRGAGQRKPGAHVHSALCFPRAGRCTGGGDLPRYGQNQGATVYPRFGDRFFRCFLQQNRLFSVQDYVRRDNQNELPGLADHFIQY